MSPIRTRIWSRAMPKRRRTSRRASEQSAGGCATLQGAAFLARMQTAAASGLEGSAEGVIGGDEEEAVELLLDQETHQRDAVRPIVGVPLHSVRRARLAG